PTPVIKKMEPTIAHLVAQVKKEKGASVAPPVSRPRVAPPAGNPHGGAHVSPRSH
ncbi:MAG: hypothetical protein HQK85_06445, partial [Nitrospinae bacterium]|nr:hypothetical protein [Nitrospinota bacterium]